MTESSSAAGQVRVGIQSGPAKEIIGELKDLLGSGKGGKEEIDLIAKADQAQKPAGIYEQKGVVV